MNSWFNQLNALVALRESGVLSQEDFEAHKKRLWQLEQELTDLGKRMDHAAALHSQNDRFQMRLMEIQIEPDGLDLEGRERWLSEMRAAFEMELRQVDQPPQSLPLTTNAVSATAQFDPKEEALLKEKTEILVAELRERLTTLRGARFDTEMWSQLDAIYDALYRNGSEPVVQWSHRVQLQSERLVDLESS